MHSAVVRERALELIGLGYNDCEIARRLDVPRTTIRDWRRPRYVPRATARGSVTCPRCWRGGRPMSFTAEDYAELLGLYLGDGHIARHARTYRLRIFLDSKYQEIVRESNTLLRRCFPQNDVGTVLGHEGRMTVLSVYSTHLPCLLPQHGAGMKHLRPVLLESWQRDIVRAEPWPFLMGCIRSDGCSFINRTGCYEYLSYGFSNYSADILQLFCATCDDVGLEYCRYARAVRINRRSSVNRLKDRIGVKR